MAVDSASTISHVADPSRDREGDREVPRLLVIFEGRQPLTPALRLSLTHSDEVEIGRGNKRTWARVARRLELWINDHEVSRAHARILRVGESWELRDLGSKNGTAVNGTLVQRTTLADGDLIAVGSAMLMFRDELAGSSACSDLDLTVAPMIAPALRTVSLEMERRVGSLVEIAPSGVAVLIRGETGTGKELTARAIHDLSGRQGAFVPVNCGALPRGLIESELFGSKRGAFSGAREDREGLVRGAHRGTLFLDEIAELPEDSQVALLRVLQDGEVRPIGAAAPLRVDVRVVAATHQDLEARITDGRFREDLYARLNGHVVALPPLRARREDIGTLVGVFLHNLVTDSTAVEVHSTAADALLTYPYPRNIRELEQAVRSAVALARGREIRLEHLPEVIRAFRQRAPALSLDEQVLRDRLIALLREHRGNVAQVGRQLGKAPMQIRRWCRRLGIEIATFRLGS